MLEDDSVVLVLILNNQFVGFYSLSFFLICPLIVLLFYLLLQHGEYEIPSSTIIRNRTSLKVLKNLFPIFLTKRNEKCEPQAFRVYSTVVGSRPELD